MLMGKIQGRVKGIAGKRGSDGIDYCSIRVAADEIPGFRKLGDYEPTDYYFLVPDSVIGRNVPQYGTEIEVDVLVWKGTTKKEMRDRTIRDWTNYLVDPILLTFEGKEVVVQPDLAAQLTAA